MGLFSRTHHSKHHQESPPKNSCGEPVSPQPRSDGKGDETRASDAHYDVGVISDCNSRYRKTMEDCSIVIMDYMGIPGCAFFGIYDGHAGVQCATAVVENLHCILSEVLEQQPPQKDVPLALSESFQKMDEQLRSMDIRHSGSTAVVAVSCFVNDKGEIVAPQSGTSKTQHKLYVANVGDSRAVLGTVHPGGSRETEKKEDDDDQSEKSHSESRNESRSESRNESRSESRNESRESIGDSSSMKTVADTEQVGVVEPKRLSYDHRCSDIYEQRRVSNAGGIIINNRVNGMLAVTRSLGDLFMKDYVVGAPYTTEVDLDKDAEEVLVMACDGLWDVCTDEKSLQLAYDSVRNGKSALTASKDLLGYALSEFSVDNLTIMVVQFKRQQ